MSLLILLPGSGGTPSSLGTPTWGVGTWGASPWGSTAAITSATVPIILTRQPVPNDTNVLENAGITIIFFDSDADIVPTSLDIKIDGVTVYNGTSFSAGYIGDVAVAGGRIIVQLAKLGGWGFETTVRVSAYAQDSLGQSVDETWEWTTRANPACYAGVTPLEIEKLLKTPLTLYLDLDVVRKTLLDNALRNRSVSNSDNRAARVVYQQGFDTEISTILNPYNLRNEDALATTVCERQSSIVIDKALAGVKARVLAGIRALRLNGVLPEEYRTAFQGYLDSVQYSYRVSLAANLVMLAHAVEAYGNKHG